MSSRTRPTTTDESPAEPVPTVADEPAAAEPVVTSLKNPELDAERGHGLDYHGQRPPNELKPDPPP